MKKTDPFPTQQQVRPQPTLTVPEERMLEFETDGNYTVTIPPLPSNPLIRLLRAWLGIGPRDERIFEELQRQQALIVLLAQQARGIRSDHEAVTEMATSDHQALGNEQGLINQVNRQTNAISSLLDRLQYYERNVSLIGRARKAYDTAITRKIAEQKREQEALQAQAQGTVLEPDHGDPDQLQLDHPKEEDHDGDTPAFV